MKPNPSIKEQIREVLIDWIGNDYADLDSLMLKLTDIIDTATREALEAYIEWSGEDNGVDFPTGKTNIDYFLEESDQSNTKGNK